MVSEARILGEFGVWTELVAESPVLLLEGRSMCPSGEAERRAASW